MQVTDDEDAIKRCQQGDTEGLAMLIRRYQVDALRLAYLLTGDRYLAEDVVQDSFLRAYRAMPRFRAGHAFQPWFHQIVTNTTRMRLRSASRRREVSLSGLLRDEASGATSLPDSAREANPAAYAERREDRFAIGQALALLTEKQREAVALRYYFAYSDQEIATILGCRVNTARHRIYDGLHALEQVIRSRFPSLLRESASASDAPSMPSMPSMPAEPAKRRAWLAHAPIPRCKGDGATMKPTTTPSAPEFEETARRLLERYAEGMPNNVNVEARVRSQLVAQEPQRHSARRRAAPRWSLGGWARGAVSLALVVTLVAGFAAALRSRGGASSMSKRGSPSATCATVTSAYAIALCPGGRVQAQVIVGQTYADPTRTALQLRLSLTGADLQIGSAAPQEAEGAKFRGMTIQDSQGDVFAANEMTTPINFAHGPYVDVFGAAEFDPLPESMLGAPQALTLRIQQIALSYFVGGTEMTLLVNGPWTVSARLTPQAGHTITFDIAPETFGGVTVQPLRLDVGPSGSAFDALNGGARLVVRISGLSPDTRRSTIANISYQYSTNDGVAHPLLSRPSWSSEDRSPPASRVTTPMFHRAWIPWWAQREPLTWNASSWRQLCQN